MCRNKAEEINDFLNSLNGRVVLDIPLLKDEGAQLIAEKEILYIKNSDSSIFDVELEDLTVVEIESIYSAVKGGSYVCFN